MSCKLFKLAISIVLVIPSVNLKAEVKTDYDHSADFKAYKTYSWMKVQSGNSLWDDRIKQDVDTELAAKGWTKVEANGDAALTAFRSTKDQQSLETFYDWFGGGRWGWRGFGGRGISTTTTEVTKIGNVVIDIFDTQIHKLLWRGHDTEDLSSNADKNIRKLQKDIQQLFKNFPPQ
jgi:hypothetical protein